MERYFEVHILVCSLAYVWRKMLGQICRRGGLGDEPRRVLVEIAGIKAVDAVLARKTGWEIVRRCVSRRRITKPYYYNASV